MMLCFLTACCAVIFQLSAFAYYRAWRNYAANAGKRIDQAAPSYYSSGIKHASATNLGIIAENNSEFAKTAFVSFSVRTYGDVAVIKLEI